MGNCFMWGLLLGTNILPYVNKNFDEFLIRRYPMETPDTILCEQCWYKNEKGDFSPAEKCLQISDYFLLSPKGSSKMCYVNYSNVKFKIEFKNNGLCPFCSDKKEKLNPNIIWSFKNESESFPLRGPCQNNILGREVDYYLALMKPCGFHINYHKILKDKKLSKFLKQYLIQRKCAHRFLYYDEYSKREKLWDIKKEVVIVIKDEFEKCR